MKLEDFAYSIVQLVFSELEHKHHFVVPAHIQKAVADEIQNNLNTLVE